jgi:Zn-dependent protease
MVVRCRQELPQSGQGRYNPARIALDYLKEVYHMLFGRSQEELVALLIALVPAFTVHEFSHAWVAYRLGDSTAKDMGRLTLNPMKHLDVFGILLVLVAGFGWAKPVPVNPYNLRRGRRDLAVVAVAGPLSNLLMAVAMALVWRLVGAGAPTAGVRRLHILTSSSG